MVGYNLESWSTLSSPLRMKASMTAAEGATDVDVDDVADRNLTSRPREAHGSVLGENFINVGVAAFEMPGDPGGIEARPSM